MLTTKKPSQFSPLALAYIGDGVYELFVRTRIIEEHENLPANLTEEERRLVELEKAIEGEEGEKKEIRPVISFGRRQQSARMPRWFSSRHLSGCSLQTGIFKLVFANNL